MAEKTGEQAYDDTGIAQRLAAELPHCKHERRRLRRTYRTHSWKSTLMVVNAVGHRKHDG